MPEVRGLSLTTCLLVVAALALARPTSAAVLQAPTATCAVADLPGLAAQFSRARRASRSAVDAAAPGGLEASQAADFWRVARAVAGPVVDDIAGRAAAFPDGPVGQPPGAAVPCDAPVRSRDEVAWRLGLAGYTAREIADVLDGHLALADLDQARARLMAGQPEEAVAAYLDARWRDPRPAGEVDPGADTRLSAVRPPLAPEAPEAPGAPGALEADLVWLSREHRVPADLVRAVMAAESAGNPRAVSAAGAIGLMQLMPGTAASLGVDPWQPRDNLRGGIVYLGRLLRAFDENPRLALIAYNAGPQHAREVRAGRAVAYRETRQYLAAIGARYRLP